MKISAISFSDKGEKLACRIAALLSEHGMETRAVRCPNGGLDKWVKRNFYSSDALVFVSSVGVAVRAISKYMVSKMTDPAVVTIDELGRYIIPTISGHVGGGNKLASGIASLIGGTAVITTATDINGAFAVDTWAVQNSLHIDNPERIKNVSAKVLAGKKITVRSDFEAIISPQLQNSIELVQSYCPDVAISFKTNENPSALRLVPPALTIGIGCKKGTDKETIAQAFAQITEENNISPNAVCAVGTIDIKAQEKGLIKFCESVNLPLYTYSAKELSELEGNFSYSDFVLDTVGVDNVCERSAIACGGKQLIVKKTVRNSVTMAVAVIPYGLIIE